MFKKQLIFYTLALMFLTVHSQDLHHSDKSLLQLQEDYLRAHEERDFSSITTLGIQLANNYFKNGKSLACHDQYAHTYEVLRESQNDSLKAEILLGQSFLYRMSGQIEKSDSLSGLLLDLRNPAHLQTCIAKIGMAQTLLTRREHLEAMVLLNQLLSDEVLMMDSLLAPRVHIMMSRVCKLSSDLNEALKHLHTASDFYAGRGLARLESDVWAQISSIYRHQQNYFKALEYSSRCIAVEPEVFNKRGFNNIISLHAANLEGVGRMEEADSLFRKAYEFNKLNPGSHFSHRPILGLLRQAIRLEHKARCDSFVQELKHLGRGNINEVDIVRVSSALCDYYVLSQNWKDLDLELETIKNRLLENPKTLDQVSYYKSQAALSESNDDFENAVKYYKLYHEIRDSVNSLRQDERVDEIEARYERRRMEMEIGSLQNEQELNAIRILAQKKKFRLSLVGLTLLVVGLSVMFYANKAIKKRNAIIEKSINEKEILLKEIHHRVKNNLQLVSALLDLQGRYIIDESALAALIEGKNRVKSMALIHQKLYQGENLTQVNAKDYINMLCESLFRSYNISSARIELKKNIENISLDVDTLVPIGLILNELVTNSLKYAFKEDSEGVIMINLVEEGSNLKLEVRDNGIGITKSDQDDLRKGFGYSLIESLTDQIEANFSLESTNGTSAVLLISDYKNSQNE